MRITILATAALSIISITQAEYILKIPMEQSQGGALPIGSIQIKPRTPPLPIENWQPAEAIYSEWANEGNIYDCSNWVPATSTQNVGVNFQQTADDCKQVQTRTKQEREMDSVTLYFRNIGQPRSEKKSIAVYSARQATGTKETWISALATYTEWANQGDIYGCSNWTPSVSTVMKDETFNQTATDCKQDQSRTKQDREQETTTLAYRNVGVPVSETSTITANSSRTATGTALCSYSRVGLTSIYWFSGTSSSSNSYVVYENGVMIKNDGGYDTKTFTLNGVNYTRGTTVKAGAGNYNYYEVCK